MAFTITIIGMGAAVLFPGISAQAALPTVVSELLSPFLGGIVLAAMLCAVMSSADTTLLSASTILTVDIIGRFRPADEQPGVLPRSRWLIAGLGVVSLVVALLLKNIITSMLFAYTVYTCGIILPVLAGFFKEKLKVTPAGALAALIGGGGLGLASKLVSVPYLDLWAIGLSAFLLFTVSYADRKMRK
jgi:SSS family solute:Na+ symporter